MDFRKYCKIYTRTGSIGGGYKPPTYDEFGFQKTKRQYIKLKKINEVHKPKIAYCPIKLPPSSAAKLYKSRQFPYIIDTRKREEYEKNHISGSIFLESLDRNFQKVNLLDNINRESYILVVNSNENTAFQAAGVLKKYGKFTNVYFVSSTYAKFKNIFDKTKPNSRDSCLKNWKHKLLC